MLDGATAVEVKRLRKFGECGIGVVHDAALTEAAAGPGGLNEVDLAPRHTQQGAAGGGGVLGPAACDVGAVAKRSRVDARLGGCNHVFDPCDLERESLGDGRLAVGVEIAADVKASSASSKRALSSRSSVLSRIQYGGGASRGVQPSAIAWRNGSASSPPSQMRSIQVR
jgi:hypothetical protein